ncbi:MAG: hypothetical protein ACMG55_15050 [Microcoleus sp.]
MGLIANGLARYFLKLGDSGALAIFALLLGALAVIFPRRVEQLDAKIVDFWYYLLGIITVLTVFFHNQSERDKLELGSEYQKISYEKGELEGRLSALKQTIGKRDEVFNDVRVASLRIGEDLMRTNAYFCHCAASPASCKQLSITRNEDNEIQVRGSHRYIVPPFLNFRELCEQYKEANLEQAWLRLSKLNSLSELSSFNTNDLETNGWVTIAQFKIPIHDVISDLLTLLSNPEEIDKKRSDLESKVVDKTNELRNVTNRYNKLGQINDDFANPMDFFIGFFWPYLLIFLLGLKIARVRYL